MAQNGWSLLKIELAKELDTLQDVTDLAYAYTMNIKYSKNEN